MSLVDQLNSELKKQPGNADLYFQRGTYYLENSYYKNAIADLEKAISLDSFNTSYYLNLSDAYLNDLRSRDAVEILEKIIGLKPGDVPSLLKLTRLQITLEQYELAILTVNEVFKVDLQNAQATFLLGTILRLQGDTESAINAFRSAVELDPEIVDAWILLGDLLDAKDDPDALQYFDNALSVAPNNLQALHAKAFYLQNHDRIPEALDLYHRIIALDSNYIDAYLNAGILYLESDSLERAYSEFDALVEKSASQPVAYYYRGLISYQLGNTDSAIADLEQSIQLSPGYDAAIRALEIVKQDTIAQ